MIEPLTTGGIIALVISGGAMWIREWRKGRSSKSNNNDLKMIRETVNDTHIKVVELKVDIKGMKDNCKQTTNRFERAINGNRKEILEIAKDKRK